MKYLRPLIVYGYIIVSLALFLFSYTQVDLNLTLSRVSSVQEIEKAFQHVGYYMRPMATSAYVAIIISFFALYTATLITVRRSVLTLRDLWHIIWTVTVLLVFSYPAALSYDFFNYMFTAKTVLVYHQNPYMVTPLAFAGVDPWTNFMRWTHLSTAYAPLWIGLTFVPYVIGFGYFVTVLFAMKFMVAGFYLLTCWALVRAMTLTDTKRVPFALAFFALNPLLLAESLVSGHNDIVLAAFAMVGVWAYYQKDHLNAWFAMALSVASKTITIVVLPLMLLKKDKRWFLGAMLLALAAVLTRREFLPWYWVWILPFIALIPEQPKLFRFAGIISMGLLLSYAPYFYFGDYNVMEQVWKTWIIWIGVAIGIASLLLPIEQQDPRR